MSYPIYLDYAATTPVDERILQEILPYFSIHFGNSASRHHVFGWQAAEAVNLARQQIADLFQVTTNEIIFTSGATESINLALKGTFEANNSKGKHIVTAKTEHKAVLDACYHLEKWGAEITYLDVNSDGEIDLQELEKVLRNDTILVSLMAANNETGVVHPLKKIIELCHQKGILFHTDATQAVGKIDFQDLSIDLLSFSGHKIFAPKGIGCLIAKKNVKIVAQQDGGSHERGRRSGTLNVPGIVGIGKACELISQEKITENKRLEHLRNRFENTLLVEVKDIHINGKNTERLPHISNITFEGIDGEEALMRLHKIAISNGSACNSASTEPSYVLKAMNRSDAQAFGSLRFSFGRFTTSEEVTNALFHIKNVMQQLR